LRHCISLGNPPSHTFTFFSSQTLRSPDTASAVPPGSPGRTATCSNINQPRLNLKCIEEMPQSWFILHQTCTPQKIQLTEWKNPAHFQAATLEDWLYFPSFV